jgi:hypothetical protein
VSKATLSAIEDAIRAHYEDCLKEDTDQQPGMIVDWFAAWTVHAIVDVDGAGPVSGYANWWAGADTNPNGQAHLAHWVGDEISSVIPGPDDET